MRFTYICDKCLELGAGKPIDSLTVDEYKLLCSQLAIVVKHSAGETQEVKCEKCGATMRKLSGMEAMYTRGYGYLDKKGVTNDMHLHTMLTGKDPYAEHRKPGDADNLINKLRRQKRHMPKRSDVFMR